MPEQDKESPPKLTARDAPAQAVKERIVEIMPTIAEAVRTAQEEGTAPKPDASA